MTRDDEVQMVKLAELRKLSMMFDILRQSLEGLEEQTGGVTFGEIERISLISFCGRIGLSSTNWKAEGTARYWQL